MTTRRAPGAIGMCARAALLGLLAGVAALSACASRAAREEATRARVATALERRGDADALAAAAELALLAPGEAAASRQHSLELARAASERAPARPDLVWLALENCGRVPGCNREPLEARLRALDPTNGAGWFGPLARAWGAKDGGAIDAALEAIGRTDHVDLYWTTLTARLATAVDSSGEMPLNRALVLIMGIRAAAPVPAYSAVSHACQGERLERLEVIEVCRAVSGALRRGDTYLTAGIGDAIALRVWPAESAAAVGAAAERHTENYRLSVAGARWNGWVLTPAGGRAYLALLSANRREQDVFAAELLAHHRPADPPPGWTPSAPR